MNWIECWGPGFLWFQQTVIILSETEVIIKGSFFLVHVIIHIVLNFVFQP